MYENVGLVVQKERNEPVRSISKRGRRLLGRNRRPCDRELPCDGHHLHGLLINARLWGPEPHCRRGCGASGKNDLNYIEIT